LKKAKKRSDYSTSKNKPDNKYIAYVTNDWEGKGYGCMISKPGKQE